MIPSESSPENPVEFAQQEFSRRDGWLLALLAALVALFFWRLLTPNLADRAQFPPGDFTDQFYAFRLYEARAFAEGRLPLWSENFNSGHPFLADVQAAVFYPIGLANTLLNVALYGSNFPLFALELEALLHFFLAGAFTYIFARRVIGSRTGAFAAAIVFTFGGYLTSYPPLQLAILETATWLPLALYFLERAIPLSSPLNKGGDTRASASASERGGLLFTFLIYAGMVLGIAALAGHPQTFLVVLATCALYFFFRVSIQKVSRPLSFSSLIAFGSVLLIGFGIAAAQWIPSLEYQLLSTREALSFREAAAGFPTLDLLQFIFPGFTSAFASPLYVGVLPLWLALLAITRRERTRIFWGLVALGALLLSFGFYVFGYALVYLLAPGAALFRQQERFALLVSFALALLTGFGLREILSNARVQIVRQLFFMLPAGAVIAFVLLITFFVAGVQTANARLAFLGDRAGLMLLLFLLASVLVGAYVRSWVSPRALAALAVGLILFDLFSVNEPANKAAPAERYPASPLIEITRSDGNIFRVADEGQLPAHFGIAYGLEEIGGISPLRLAHYDNLLALAPERLLPLLNVKYFFTARSSFAGAQVAGQAGKTRLLRLSNPLPRAWWVGAVMVEADDARALTLMQSNDFDPRRSAVLASPAPFAPDPRAVDGNIMFDSRAPERIVLNANTPVDGVLVLSENFYPGWVARVDGAPVEILRADVSLRAVPLRAGTHQVEVVYDPLSVKLGLGISLVTLLLVAATLFIFR